MTAVFRNKGDSTNIIDINDHQELDSVYKNIGRSNLLNDEPKFILHSHDESDHKEKEREGGPAMSNNAIARSFIGFQNR